MRQSISYQSRLTIMLLGDIFTHYEYKARMWSPKRINVVTAFLENGDRILILRRSSNVKTMKGKWGAVSGYLETNDPSEQAIIEINEETGLSNGDIQFVRAGKVVQATDPDNPNSVYAVHPYLFHAKSRKIRLSSEHDLCRWVPIEDLWRYDAVPKLKEAWESVRGIPENTNPNSTNGS